MKTAQVSTHCECQGRLRAVLDEGGRVLSGTVRGGSGQEEAAPATGISIATEQFQVGWLCPLCGRNTVRSFYKGALLYKE